MVSEDRKTSAYISTKSVDVDLRLHQALWSLHRFVMGLIGVSIFVAGVKGKPAHQSRHLFVTGDVVRESFLDQVIPSGYNNRLSCDP